MEKDQLRDELQRTKLAFQRSEEERQHQQQMFENKFTALHA